MRPHFHCNPAPRYGAEHLRYGFFGASDASFQHHFALFVQHAIAAALISQVQADRDRASLPARLLAGPVDFPAHFVCPFTRALFRDVILLHGRLLFALRVRSHWELIASRWEPAFSFHLCFDYRSVSIIVRFRLSFGLDYRSVSIIVTEP